MTQDVTEQDRLTEKSVGATMSAKWNLEVRFANEKRLYDFALHNADGSAFAIVEVKRRNCPSKKFKEYMCFQSKILSLRREADEQGCNAILCVVYDDAMLWTEIAPKGYRGGMGGRKDRGRASDWRPCFFLPLTQFKSIEERP